MAHKNGDSRDVDLDVLFRTRRVKLGGKWYNVKPLNGLDYKKLMAVTSKGAEGQSGEDMIAMYEIAERVLDSKDAWEMSATQLAALVATAQADVKEVESHIPKKSAPAKGTNLAPA